MDSHSDEKKNESNQQKRQKETQMIPESPPAPLRPDTDFLRYIIDLHHSSIHIKDRYGRYLFANKAQAELYGVTVDELIGKTDSDFMTNRQETALSLKTDRRIITTGKPETIPEYAFTHPETGKLLWFECRKFPLSTPDGHPCILSISIDITARRENERQLDEAKREAERADVLKSQFLSNMGHEIRTPLNAILGFTELLKELIEHPEQSEYLSHIDKGGQHLLELINDILDLSKIEAGRIEILSESFSVRDLLQETKSRYIESCREKGLELIIDIDDRVPDTLITDEKRLQQILENLIDNAIKFTSAGIIRVALSVDGSLKFDPGNEEKSPVIDLKLSVSDSGIGIPEELHGEIFKNFFRQSGKERSNYKGTGLGLAIVRRLTEMLNGEISIESQPGEGSIFTLIFRDVPVSGHFEDQKQKRPAKDVSGESPEKKEQWFIGLVGFNKAELSRIQRRLVIPDAEEWSAMRSARAVEQIGNTPTEMVLLNPSRPVSFYRPLMDALPNYDISAVLLYMHSALEDASWTREDITLPVIDLENPESAAGIIRQIREPKPFAEANREQPLNDEEKSEAVTRIRDELLPRWQRLKNKMIIGDIATFAVAVTGIGESYRIGEFVQFGRKLKRDSIRLDIEKIRDRMSAFENISTSILKELDKNV